MKYVVQKTLRTGKSKRTELVEAEGLTLVVKSLQVRTTDLETMKLFEREGATLKQLSHPRIPQVINTWAEEDNGEVELKIAQEHIEGKNLRELLDAEKRFTEAEVIQIGIEVASILEYLHELRPPLIHRDIKLSNLIMSDEGDIYLIDFGAVSATKPTGETMVGTSGYMPPEQFEGNAKPSSDVYALGFSLIALLTHYEPWENPAKARETLVASGVSPSLRKLLQNFIARDDAQRPQNGSAAHALLKTELSTVQSPASKAGGLVPRQLPDVLPPSVPNAAKEDRQKTDRARSPTKTKVESEQQSGAIKFALHLTDAQALTKPATPDMPSEFRTTLS